MDDRRVRVEHLRHARGQAVVLDTEHLRRPTQPLGHEAKEVAGSDRGFQHCAAGKAHLLDRLPHRLHDGLAGEVRRGGRIARGTQLGRRKQGLQLGNAALPALRDTRAIGGARHAEGVLEATPADIAGQDALFGRACPPVFGFDLLERLDRSQVVLELGAGAALAQLHVIRDREVDGRDVVGRGVLDRPVRVLLRFLGLAPGLGFRLGARFA